VLATYTAQPADLVPPLAMLERAAFDGAPRPADGRVEAALGAIEASLEAAGLVVTYRSAKEWSVELEVGSDEEAGILLLHFRKNGSFSSRTWRRPPGSATAALTNAALDRLAHD
jgi:hypothetical protein